MGDLHRDLYCQVILVSLLVHGCDGMEDKLTFFWRSVLEVNFEIAARPYTDALGAIVLAQFNSVHEL